MFELASLVLGLLAFGAVFTALLIVLFLPRGQYIVSDAIGSLQPKTHCIRYTYKHDSSYFGM